MLTTPLTTPQFHDRVLSTLAKFLQESEGNPNGNLSTPIIPSLSAHDTPLAPDEIISQLVAVASPWIDLSSPDPVVYDISCQVLKLEVAYAAFCGIGNIILPAPRLHHGNVHGDGIVRYANAIQEALGIGPYIQFLVTVPMVDEHMDQDILDDRSLAAKARELFTGLAESDGEDDSMHVASEEESPIRQSNSKGYKPSKYDSFGTWDAWNIIRSICKYSNRLFVGKKWIAFSLKLSSSTMTISSLSHHASIFLQICEYEPREERRHVLEVIPVSFIVLYYVHGVWLIFERQHYPSHSNSQIRAYKLGGTLNHYVSY